MIQIDLHKCTGCHRCETACAFFHTGRTGRHHSRIKVVNLYESGIDGPVVCQQCQERYCLKCTKKALRAGSLGQIIVSPTVCSECSACEINCPIGAVEMYNGIAYVCDLCGGNPKCIEACTEGAIQYLPEQSEVISLKTIKDDTRRMNPSEKRAAYISRLGEAVIRKWRKKHA